MKKVELTAINSAFFPGVSYVCECCGAHYFENHKKCSFCGYEEGTPETWKDYGHASLYGEPHLKKKTRA